MRDDLRINCEEAIDNGVTDEALARAKKRLADVWDEFHSDFEERVKQYLSYNLAAWAQEMADKAIEALLRGDVEEMMRRLHCADNQWTGRDREHMVIHGRLSEHDPMVLRKQVVDAFPQLLKDQRVIDLEDQVASLVKTVNKLEREKEEMWQRVRSTEGF